MSVVEFNSLVEKSVINKVHLTVKIYFYKKKCSLYPNRNSGTKTVKKRLRSANLSDCRKV